MCAFFYALGPVTLFVFAGQLFRCWRTAWFAGLAYSAVPASLWLMRSVQGDMGVWLGIDLLFCFIRILGRIH